MKRQHHLLASLLTGLLIFSTAGAQDPMSAGFVDPPTTARPFTWWHWMNGNVSRTGITEDLESLKSAGVGGVQIFNVGLDIPPGDVKFMSPAWREMLSHAVRESDRLGLQFSIHTCDGWSESGGPWITPDLAMQKLTWAEIRITDVGPISQRLPAPNAIKNYYKDVSVLAYPTPPNDLDTALLSATAPVTDVPRDAQIESASPGGSIALPKPTPDQPRTLTWTLPRPVTLRSLTVGFRTADGPAAATLEASDDGKSFRPIGALPTAAESFSVDHLTTWSFSPVTASVFRVVISKGGRLPNVVCRISLHTGDRIDRVENKAGDAPRESTTALSSRAADPSDLLDPGATLDLTQNLAPDGTLTWTAPPSPTGQWTILRLGHTLTGRTNQAATEEGLGLECDKFNPVAVRAHFNAFAAKILAENKGSIGKSFNLLHLDSWEALCQNWTPDMRAQFQRRRGYDPVTYYPVFAGRIVTSIEVSERFLYDFRRTIADLINDNHFKLLTQLCNENGVQLEAEATGPNMPTIAHGLEAKAHVNIPMGEFWVGREVRADCKEASASANIHGKSIVPAEAFTAVKGDFTDDFYSLKPLGDTAFTHGINRFIFHRFVHQPWPDRFPGMGMGPYGINFDRTNTWWPEVRVWNDYLARCQFLLQSGTPTADVLYYTGENVPFMLPPRRDLRPQLPPGWDYDACTAEELLTLAKVIDDPNPSSNHRVVSFPAGPRYHLIVLPDATLMSPVVLAKLRDLVVEGAIIVGPRPERSPSLTDHPACDQKVQSLASELWGTIDGQTITRNNLGKGRVYSGLPLADVLADLDVPPDVSVASATTAQPINFIHRRVGSSEVYFLSNPSPSTLDTTITLRDAPGTPELWDPATGRITPANTLPTPGPGVTLQLRFDPAGSIFVVFRPSNRPRISVVGPDPQPDIQWHDRTLTLATTRPGTYSITLPSPAHPATPSSLTVHPLPAPLALPGPYAVTFTPPFPKLGPAFTATLDDLSSWHLNPDPRISGFSGTATYALRFTLPSTLSPRDPLYIDLGKVKNIARLRLNGQDLGTLWKPPFRADLSRVLRPGENKLEIRITNLWPNRLIADAALPPESRLSFTTTNFWTRDSKPLESGLIGPLLLTPGTRVNVIFP